MEMSSIGDLSRGLMMRRQQSALKTEISALSAALATGQKQDLRSDLRGDFGPLAAMNQRLGVLDAYDHAVGEAAAFFGTVQAALGALGDGAQEVGRALAASGGSLTPSTLDIHADQANSLFDQAVGWLNTQVAGRSLFAGAATDGPALEPAADIRAALAAEVAGLTTAGDIRDAVRGWFHTPGGGFETLAYRGSPQPAGPLVLALGEKVEQPVLASDPALRELLCGLALASFVGEDGGLGLGAGERSALAGMAGNTVLDAAQGVILLGASVGMGEALIESIGAANAAERVSLQAARNRLTAADPYETATALEQAQTRLETLYAITARLSRLSLADYLS
ncbi:flagellar hook-associated protein 3 FlgL [Rhodovulum bhavnagarense]|uniref:Flagellar hook-associated protein 3 FlgL n=1 Tax=Rhodovulum bhavnagarense TaxID=992286 RepID=A0A4R2RN30_9RHOB|nr:flagellin [Rhodovulum bhavnagarense]TCP61171.1 flagellar hook-associated protein 3 FlgL [Rhodovulum bhavnagarense]